LALRETRGSTEVPCVSRRGGSVGVEFIANRGSSIRGDSVWIRRCETIFLALGVLWLAFTSFYAIHEVVNRLRAHYVCTEDNIPSWGQCIQKTYPVVVPYQILRGLPRGLPCNCVYMACTKVTNMSAAHINAGLDFFSTLQGIGFGSIEADSADNGTVLRHPIRELSSKGLARQKSLRYITGWHTELEEVPRGLEKLPNLEYVNFALSRISEVPEWIASLPRLRFIDLRVNSVTSLPASITKMKDTLELLLLEYNPICYTDCFHTQSKSFLSVVNKWKPCGVTYDIVDFPSDCVAFCELGRALWHTMDTNKDGLVCVDEYQQYILERRPSWGNVTRFREVIHEHKDAAEDDHGCATGRVMSIYATSGVSDCQDCSWAAELSS